MAGVRPRAVRRIRDDRVHHVHVGEHVLPPTQAQVPWMAHDALLSGSTSAPSPRCFGHCSTPRRTRVTGASSGTKNGSEHDLPLSGSHLRTNTRPHRNEVMTRGVPAWSMTSSPTSHSPSWVRTGRGARLRASFFIGK